MIDHISITVGNFEKSKEFYSNALAPIGITKAMEFPGVAGFGEKGGYEFWIHEGDPKGVSSHVAFRVEKRSMVDEFYKAALEAGGKDNGKPGIREQYSPNYYAAFVYDLDGHNIEAVCFGEE